MSVAPVPIHHHPQFRQINDETRVPYDAEWSNQQPKPRRPRMSEPFVMASLKVLHKSGLSDGAKIVYLTLRHHQNPETGQCNPSIDRIADEVEKTPRSIMRLLDELESAGWITRERTNKTYNYTFPDEPVPVVRPDKNVTTGYDENVTSEDGSDLTNVSHPTGQKCHVRPDKNVTQSITKNKNKELEKNSLSVGSLSSGDPTSRAKPKVPIPPDFALTDERRAYAQAKGFDDRRIELEFERFVNYANQKDWRNVDWHRTWQNWILGELKRNPPQIPRKKTGWVGI